ARRAMIYAETKAASAEGRIRIAADWLTVDVEREGLTFVEDAKNEILGERAAGNRLGMHLVRWPIGVYFVEHVLTGCKYDLKVIGRDGATCANCLSDREHWVAVTFTDIGAGVAVRAAQVEALSAGE